ncbi:eukaryotic translation initiation factor 3 subunit I [Rhynchocyon petersi]
MEDWVTLPYPSHRAATSTRASTCPGWRIGSPCPSHPSHRAATSTRASTCPGWRIGSPCPIRPTERPPAPEPAPALDGGLGHPARAIRATERPPAQSQHLPWMEDWVTLPYPSHRAATSTRASTCPGWRIGSPCPIRPTERPPAQSQHLPWMEDWVTLPEPSEPQSGHQHQSQHLPWMEDWVTMPCPTSRPCGQPSPNFYSDGIFPVSSPGRPAPPFFAGRGGVGHELRFGVWKPKEGRGRLLTERRRHSNAALLPGREGRRPSTGSCVYLFRFCSGLCCPRVPAGMKPILLQGHERSITQIKYNREGDLLFTVAKDPIVNVWYSVNGERLGTYMGHTGAVWCVDADWDTKHVLTGSADNSCRLWDCETGKQLALLKTNSAVRTCGFDFGGNIIMFSTDKQMGYQCFVSFFDLRDPSQIDSNEPYMKIPCSDSKITSAVWGPLGECIIAGHENGELNQFSAKSGEVLVNVKEHSRQINDIQLSRDMTMFVTASKDNTSKLFDSTTLEHQKTFRTERPVNSAALSPNYDHVVLGGGQEAMDVTTTSTRIGKFEARFFHLAFEEEFGRVKGHFGPINSVAFHPDGKSYSSGGEDGYVRIHYFDPQYFEFEFEA